MTVGEKIRALRKRERLTQTELGKMIGVKKNAVSKWENDYLIDIPAGRIKAMAKIFDVPPSYLIDDDLDRTPLPAIAGEVSIDDLKFAIFGSDAEITDEMYEEVKQFAAFVKNRNQHNKQE